LARGVAVPRWHVGTPSIASDLLMTLEDEAFTDVSFEVEGARITAHRVILAARSEYFRRMLQSSCREAQPGAVIRIGETTAAAFRKVLAFLYTDTLELDDVVVVNVMCKAREYALTRLYNMCMRYCTRAAQPSNAVAWLLAADASSLEELRAEMLQYVRRHFRTIRAESHASLAELCAHPGLMLELMEHL